MRAQVAAPGGAVDTVAFENGVHEVLLRRGDCAMAQPDVDVVEPFDRVRSHEHGRGAGACQDSHGVSSPPLRILRSKR